VRRLEGEFLRWGECEIEVRLLEVGPYTPRPVSELIGSGPEAVRGARVRVEYKVWLRGSDGAATAEVGGSGETGESLA
jgi:hypothetical protein